MTSNTSKDLSDFPSPAQDVKLTANGEPGAEQNAAPGSLAAFQADLEAAKAESNQWRDKFLRKAAELENFRKRSERERIEASTLVRSSLLIEFLPIMDACERARESFREGDNEQGRLKKFRDGVELLYKQLGDTLGRLGVVAMEAKGRKFDPHLHEALTRLETPEYEDNTVIEELRRGYMLKDRLLRPAQVVVSSCPKPEVEE